MARPPPVSNETSALEDRKMLIATDTKTPAILAGILEIEQYSQ